MVQSFRRSREGKMGIMKYPPWRSLMTRESRHGFGAGMSDEWDSRAAQPIARSICLLRYGALHVLEEDKPLDVLVHGEAGLVEFADILVELAWPLTAIAAPIGVAPQLVHKDLLLYWSLEPKM